MERWKHDPEVLGIEIYKGKQEFIEDAEAGRAGGYWQLAEYEEWEPVESWQRPQTLELLASTEGDPIRKFCCRICGECAPKELLEEGRFLDRISWLRSHYQAKHPGKWGTMSPMTVVDGEPVLPEYRHLVGLINEPLPKDAY
ncbi:hypothetical protein KKF82_06840 [Patescibacteria group bacterium]|nr:hypothetical protein [Patescibacteria group bacterium]